LNILVLNGSPRGEKSISLSLSRQFLEGFQTQRKQQGEAPAPVREVHLVNSDIQSCRGCFACWRNEGQCVIKDDMVELLPAYRQADLVIWSMPLYHFGMPALLKNFLERTLPEVQGAIVPDGDGSFTHPLRNTPGEVAPKSLSGKTSAADSPVRPRNLLVSTCGFPSTKNNCEPLHAHFNQLFGQGQWERIECVQAELLKVPELRSLSEAYYDKVRQAGNEWAQGQSSTQAWFGFSPELRAQLDSPLMEPMPVGAYPAPKRPRA